MGIYLIPKGKKKETWLKEFSEGIMNVSMALAEFDEIQSAGNRVVVYVDNGEFSVAAVAYDKAELQALTHPDDPRPKIVYIVQYRNLLRDDSGFNWQELEIIRKGGF